MTDREARNRAATIAREFDPYPAEFLDREFEVYRTLREHLPIARSEAMQNASLGQSSGGWVVTRYEDGCGVLRTPEDFSSQTQKRLL